jgi:hypothetical protein
MAIFKRCQDKSMSLVHSQRLERWLGTQQVEDLSRGMRGWYGPPIAVAGVPGEVYANSDGDFSGKLRCGELMSGVDWAVDQLRRRCSAFPLTIPVC